MNEDTIPILAFFLALAWMVFVGWASIYFRRKEGKPIFPRVPSDALYADKWASGRWASNCLIVAVTPKAVSIVPKFPFNLWFMPDIYGLERTIHVADIRGARQLRGFGILNNVAVQYGNEGRELRLKVRKPQAFVDALRSPNIRIAD